MFNKDYIIKGKHVDYIRELASTTSSDTMISTKNIFKYGHDILVLAPIIGASLNIRGKEEVGLESKTYSIKAPQVIGRSQELKNIFRLILLNYGKEVTDDNIVEYVFRSSEKELEKHMGIFHEFLLGGIEYLYKEIIPGGIEIDGYLNNMLAFIEEYNIKYLVNIEDVEDFY